MKTKPRKTFKKRKTVDKPVVKNVVTSEKTQHHAELLANRVKKRFRHLSRRFKRQQIDCFRLYDWDIPEVRAVVDWYAGHLVVAEYIRLQTGPKWLPMVAKAAAEALGVPPEKTHVKRRQTHIKVGTRYKRLSSKGIRFKVKERDLLFWVNLDDFLDTGLFSDHRDTRVMVRDMVKGKDFLNLYAYTGAFTCAAAAGGARSTVTVDRSETYLKWAKGNLKLNGFDGRQHQMVQSDVDRYLTKAYRAGHQFDVIFVDPPSFFQDKQRNVSFDINRDHPELLQNVLKITAPDGIIIFSTNHQRFEPRFEDLPVKDIKDITAKTIPEDYRNPQIHRC
ncbi:MAG: class I SAM-dependent methyltransferase, partial [Candidatus Omnitrophica bacterium]|nr:class I SAM-dependent methyltransferase [Candidatus Omnitrophota bacterium]